MVTAITLVQQMVSLFTVMRQALFPELGMCQWQPAIDEIQLLAVGLSQGECHGHAIIYHIDCGEANQAYILTADEEIAVPYSMNLAFLAVVAPQSLWLMNACWWAAALRARL